MIVATDPVQAAQVSAQGELIVSNVSKWFGGVHALRDVTIAAGPEQGNIVGVIGPNGSGKTTLFNCISGTLAVAGGTIQFEDEDITKWPAHWRARFGLARTFQGVQLFNSLPVRSNLLIGARSVSVDSRDESAGERVARVSEMLAIDDVLDERPASLPLGRRRMVDLAAALCLAPRMLLLDEPASGLDAVESEDFASVLRDIAAANTRILVIEHDMDVMLSVADYIYVLDFGTLIARGVPSDVVQDQGVIDVYLGSSGPVTEGAT